LEVVEMHEAKKWYIDQKISRALAALEKNGFQTFFASSGKAALEKVLTLIPPEAKVGIGGSVTIREIGLIDALLARGNQVFHHWQKGISSEEVTAIMKQELNSDIFIASSNAVTEDGKLVNADQTGNRVASMIFGPQKVIVIAGINKIVRDVAEGIQRIKNVATPMNSKRLGQKTSCAMTGKCTECDAPDKPCRVTTIIEKKPIKTDITVILVGEELGF
jgi:hypothetical protein